MMSSVMNTNHDYFDGESLLDTLITLPSAQLQRAAQRCESIPDADLQWQTYLDAIALFGVEEWLRDRAPSLPLHTGNNPLLNARGILTHRLPNCLEVGGFQLCVLSMGTLTDTVVPVPVAAVNDAEQVPHFYVLATVEEEEGRVRITGFLRSDQLMQHHPSALSVTEDGTYAFNLDWFETDPDDLLLYLRCLEPEAIPRPVASTTPATDPIFAAAATQAMNVGTWLRDRLDEVAEELAWVLLPPRASAPAMLSTRTPVEQYDAVVSELLERGIDIPTHARGAYRDLAWEHTTLRLYGATWELQTSGHAPEWTLLLILGAPLGAQPPLGIRMIVRDDQQTLVDQTLTEQSPNSYLFAQVVGERHEQFWVTVDMNNGAVVTLPPFRFAPDAL